MEHIWRLHTRKRERRFASNLFFPQRRDSLVFRLESDHVGLHSREGLPPDDHLGFRLFSRGAHCCISLGGIPSRLDRLLQLQV